MKKILIFGIGLVFIFEGVYGASIYLFSQKLKTGVAAYKLHQYSQAEKFFREALTLAPFSDRGYLELGKSLLAQGEKEEAVKSFNKSLALGAGNFFFRSTLSLDSSYVHANLGRAFLAESNYSQAETEYRKAIEINPPNPYANVWLASLLKDKNGSESEVLQLVRKATESNPDNLEILVPAAEIYSYYGKYDEASQVIESALHFRSNDCESLNVKANISVLLGKQGEALEILKEILDNNNVIIKLPDCLAESYFLTGRIMEETKNIPEAIASYQKASDIKNIWNNQDLRGIQGKAKERIEIIEKR